MTTSKIEQTKRTIYILLICCILIFSLLCTITLFQRFKIINNDAKASEPEFYDYQMIRYDPETGRTTNSGFTTIPIELKEDEVITYEDDHGGINMISPLDSTEYVCRGTCYCESESRRTTSSTTIPRKMLTFLIASVSSLSVLENIARKQLQEKCEDSGLECKDTSTFLTSELDGCEQEEEDIFNDPRLTEHLYGKDVTMHTIRGYFVCKGYCIPSVVDQKGVVEDKHFYTDELKKEIEYCEQMVVTESYDFRELPLFKGRPMNVGDLEFMKENYMKRTGRELSVVWFAQKRWEINFLDPWCKRVSNGRCLGRAVSENGLQQTNRRNKCKKSI